MGWKIEHSYWEELSRVNMMSSMLPKLAVDSWGYTSEGTNNNPKEALLNRPTSINASVMLAQYKNYQKAWNDYLNSIMNFINQSDLVLVVNGLIGRLPESLHAPYFQKSEEIGRPYSTHHVHLTVVNLNNAKCELDKFQTEFRNRFKDLVDVAALKKLEEQETSKLEKAWSLWYQFAHHPEKQWQDSPDVRTAAITRKTSADLISMIKNTLAKNTAVNWKARILSETFCFEEQPALWVGLDLQDLSSLEVAYFELAQVLTNAIRPIEYKDLKYFVLTNNWKNIVIIPMMQGKTLSDISWRIFTGSFAGQEPVLDENKAWLYMPQPLPETAVSYFQFEQIKTNNFEKMQSLSKELAELCAVTIHFSNFIEILPNLNETGGKILENYLSEFYKKMAGNILKADAIIADLKTEIESDDISKLEIIRNCEGVIYHYGKPDDNQITISLRDCKEWALLLQESLSILQLSIWN